MEWNEMKTKSLCEYEGILKEHNHKMRSQKWVCLSEKMKVSDERIYILVQEA